MSFSTNGLDSVDQSFEVPRGSSRFHFSNMLRPPVLEISVYTWDEVAFQIEAGFFNG